MKPVRFLSLIPLLLFAAASANAAPTIPIPVAVELSYAQVRNICHHYKWSSRRHCTSERTLMFAARPPLFYPHKYFGGTPHYAQRFHSASYPYYRFHRWYGPPFRYPYYAY